MTWEKPLENGETVSNYIVFYKKAAEKGGYKSVSLLHKKLCLSYHSLTDKAV